MNPVVVMNTRGGARPMGMQVTATCDEEEDWTLSRASADPLVAVYPVLVMNTIMVMNGYEPFNGYDPFAGYEPSGGCAPYGGCERV